MAQISIPAREELEAYAAKNPLIRPAEVLAMLRVLRAGEAVETEIFDRPLREYGISRGKFSVLIILFQMEEPVRPSRLAEIAGVTRATISMMLTRMKRDGLVEEFIDEKDRRQKSIRLTAKGRRIMEELMPLHYQHVSQMMGKLTGGEQEELIRLLKKITD